LPFGLNGAQLDAAGAHWTAREVLQQPQVWAEIHSLLAGEAARLREFLDPLLARPEVRIPADRRRKPQRISESVSLPGPDQGHCDAM